MKHAKDFEKEVIEAQRKIIQEKIDAASTEGNKGNREIELPFNYFFPEIAKECNESGWGCYYPATRDYPIIRPFTEEEISKRAEEAD